MERQKEFTGKEEAAPLTEREIEVLSLIYKGMSSKQVAAVLGRSKHTIDFHLANIFEKLGVSSRMHALRRATTIGILETIVPSRN